MPCVFYPLSFSLYPFAVFATSLKAPFNPPDLFRGGLRDGLSPYGFDSETVRSSGCKLTVVGRNEQVCRPLRGAGDMQGVSTTEREPLKQCHRLSYYFLSNADDSSVVDVRKYRCPGISVLFS